MISDQKTIPAGNKVSSELFEQILGDLRDMNAEAVELFEVNDTSTTQKVAVVASGHSAEHVHQIANQVLSLLENGGIDTPGVEGIPECDWVLIATTNVMFHIFRPEVRAYYNLEKLLHVADSKATQLALADTLNIIESGEVGLDSNEVETLYDKTLVQGFCTATEMFKEISDFLRSEKYKPSHRPSHTSQIAYSIEMLTGLCCFLAVSPLFEMAIANDRKIHPDFISAYSVMIDSNRDLFLNCSNPREEFIRFGKLYAGTTDDQPLSEFIAASLFFICYRISDPDSSTLAHIDTHSDPHLLSHSNQITYLLTRHLSHVRGNFYALLNSMSSQHEQIFQPSETPL